MEKRAVEHVTRSRDAPTISIDSTIQGYLLSCRCEGKSAKTISIYRMVLRNFLWFSKEHQFPPHTDGIKADHIRQFLWYLASESNRWGSTNPAVRKSCSLLALHPV